MLTHYNDGITQPAFACSKSTMETPAWKKHLYLKYHSSMDFLSCFWNCTNGTKLCKASMKRFVVRDLGCDSKFVVTYAQKGSFSLLLFLESLFDFEL